MKYFLDYLQISFNVSTKSLSKRDLQTSKNLLYNFSRPLKHKFKTTPLTHSPSKISWVKEFDKKNTNNPLSIYELIKGFNINYKGFLITWNPIHHNICLHFKGSFFFGNKGIKYDLIDCKRIYDPIFDHIRSKFNQYYKNPPLVYATISKIDIACNHFNKNLIGAKAIYHKSLSNSHKYVDPRTNIITSINLGSYNSRKLYFRSYDKSFDINSSHSKIRFNSNKLVRNEWSCRADFLRNHKIRSIYDFEEIVFNKRGKKENLFKKEKFHHLTSFILYLRTLRDVIPKSSLTNSYKIVHFDEGYKVFKNLKPLYNIKTKTWSPDDQIYGTLKNHISEISDKTIENIIYMIHTKKGEIFNYYLNSIKE